MIAIFTIVSGYCCLTFDPTRTCAVATLPNASRMRTSTRVGAPAGSVIEVSGTDWGDDRVDGRMREWDRIEMQCTDSVPSRARQTHSDIFMNFQ